MQLLGGKEIGKKFGIPYYSVMKLAKTGVIPFIQIGNGRGSKVLFNPDLVETSLEQHMLKQQKVLQGNKDCHE